MLTLTAATERRVASTTAEHLSSYCYDTLLTFSAQVVGAAVSGNDALVSRGHRSLATVSKPVVQGSGSLIVNHMAKVQHHPAAAL
jgi:hypothetical protein